MLRSKNIEKLAPKERKEILTEISMKEKAYQNKALKLKTRIDEENR